MRNYEVLVHSGSVFRRINYEDEKELRKYAIGNKSLLFQNLIVYVDEEKKLSSIANTSKFVDGVFLTGKTPYDLQLWIVEYELEGHPFDIHILPQVNGFIRALKNERSRRLLRDLIFENILRDKVAYENLKVVSPNDDVRYLIESVIDRNQVGITIVIDRNTEKLREFVDEDLKYKGVVKTTIQEFLTFQNSDNGDDLVFLFDTLQNGKTITQSSSDPQSSFRKGPN